MNKERLLGGRFKEALTLGGRARADCSVRVRASLNGVASAPCLPYPGPGPGPGPGK